MKKYWEKAISFEYYMKVAEQRLKQPKNDQEREFAEYYELGLHRMERTLKTLKLDQELLDSYKHKNFQGKVLIISEPWCGDASATVPAVSKFLEAAGTEVRIFLRDDDTSLINLFLTDGTQSIPKILLLDSEYNLVNVWGPRPKHDLELLKKFKQNPETYPKDDFYNDLQVYYAKNRGRDAIEELIDLL